MQNTPFSSGPLALTTTLTTNILNPPTTTGGVNAGTPNTYILITHIHISNKTAGAATFSLWMGATGANTAGTEFWGTGVSIAANDFKDWYGRKKMKVADFLVGGSNTATALTIIIEGEMGVEF